MLVLVLPGVLLIIIGGIIASAYLIFRPEPLASVEEKAKARARERGRPAQGRPAQGRRPRPRL